MWVVLMRDLCNIWWETELLLKWAALTKHHSWQLCCAYLCATMAHYSSQCFTQLQAILRGPCWGWVSPLHNPGSVVSTCFVSCYHNFYAIQEVFSELQHILSPTLGSVAWLTGVPLLTVFWQMQFLQPKGSFTAGSFTFDINLLVLQAGK